MATGEFTPQQDFEELIPPAKWVGEDVAADAQDFIDAPQRLMQIPDPVRIFTDSLAAMYSAQHELQVKAYGKDPITLGEEERIQFIKDMILALTDELHEFLAETGWKPWATSRHIHTEAAAGELVDAWHFFMNLMLAIGMTPEDLFVGYMEKRGRNLKRQQEGYDGVAGKCQSCGRALDDIAAKQGVPVEEVWRFINGKIFCQVCLDASEEGESS